MSRKCITCGVEIDPRRIAILPGTQTCTQHSTTEKKAAVTVQMGEGDHTWTETFAVDRETLRKIEEVEKNYKKLDNPTLSTKLSSSDDDEYIPSIDDFDIDEDEESKSFEDELDEFTEEEE